MQVSGLPRKIKALFADNDAIEELITLMRSLGLSNEAAVKILTNGIKEYSDAWWEREVFSALTDPEYESDIARIKELLRKIKT